LKDIPEVPQREREFFQLCVISLRGKETCDVLILDAFGGFSSDHKRAVAQRLKSRDFTAGTFSIMAVFAGPETRKFLASR